MIHALSNDPLATLMFALFLAALIWIMFFRKDQFDAYRDREWLRPSCYLSNPGPQAQAENDCASCCYQHRCVVPLDALLPPHLHADRVPAVRLFYGHTLYTNADGDARPEAIVDRNGDTVLGLCKRCGAGEIELDEPCAFRIERLRLEQLSRERADWDGQYAHDLSISAQLAGTCDGCGCNLAATLGGLEHHAGDCPNFPL